MKTAETKTISSHNYRPKTGNRPFFGKSEESSFFAEVTPDIQTKPFFDFINTSHNTIINRHSDEKDTIRNSVESITNDVSNPNTASQSIQPKCAECEAVEKEDAPEELTEEVPQIQEKSLFVSEGAEKNIQAKSAVSLTVGEPNDQYEQEADAMADQVVQMLSEPEFGVNDVNNNPELQTKPESPENSINTKSATENLSNSTDSPVTHIAPLPSTISLIQSKCEECEKEEAKEMDELPELQKKSLSDIAGSPPEDENPDLQRRTLEMEKTEYPILFKRIPEVQLRSSGRSESNTRDKIIEVAQKMVGKIEAKKNDGSGRRVGSEHLLEIFHLAAKDAWPDQVIENVRYTKEFPHWCGIFSVYVIKKAGIDLGYWEPGLGVSNYGTLQPTGTPQPGDIGYFHEKQHHCIIKAVNGDTIESIDGNSGNFSEVVEMTRPRSAFTGGFMTAFTGSEQYIQKKEETEATQTSGNGSLEDKLKAKAGMGSSMDETTKTQMESGFQADFSGVNIHTDSDAVSMNRSLNAQAFTHGSDIYFNEGKYNPGTTSGKHLLAHELTHTVQQGVSSIGPSIQKNGTDEEEIDPTKLPLEKGQMNAAKTEITFNNIKIPGFKLKAHRGGLYNSHAPLKRMRGYDQSLRPEYISYKKNWLEGIPNTAIKQKLKDKLKSDFKTENDTYVFKALLSGSKGTSNPYYFGKLEDITEQLKQPTWGGKDKKQKFKKFNIDHIVELQLANWNADKWANEVENLEFLETGRNKASGDVIKKEINKKIDVFNKATKDQFVNKAKNTSDKQREIKKKYTLIFNKADAASGAKKTIATTDFWTKTQITDGDHLATIVPAHLNELDKEGEVKVFPKPGVRPKTFIWKPGMEENISPGERRWFGKQIVVSYKKFDTESISDELGHVRVTADEKEFLKKYSLKYSGRDIVIPIKRLEGTKGVGYVGKDSAKHHLLEWFKEMSFNPFSPLRVDNLDFGSDGMLIVSGKIVPGLPIIKGAEIDFRMQNGNVQIFKEFTGPELNLPSPFNLKNTTLRVYADSVKGLGISGAIDFEIEKLAQGHLEAGLSQSTFSIKGDLDFESNWFEPAKLSASYTKLFGEAAEGEKGEPEWYVAGKLGLKKDIKGVKKLLLEASYDGQVFSASGDVEFDIPGIKGGLIEASYNNETKDFGIAGEFQLSNDIPGITGGCVAASFTREGATGDYSLGLSGSAQPDIPGLNNTSLCISYKDGIFVIEGETAFKKGIASGRVKVGVTNRAIDEKGKPIEGETKTLSVYGNGSLTVKFSEFLEGTVGAKVTPKGKIILSGEIKIPDKIPLTREKDEFNKTIVPFPTVSIPIIGISAMGKTVGIAAKISGGVDAYASLGPLSLTELYLKLNEFDPMEPSTAEVEGGASIDYPAKAGLKVKMNVGVALSVLIVEAGGELIGSLGLELYGNAGANIKLKWTASKGLEFIEAKAKVEATAQMIMNLRGRLYVDLDLLLKTINLWEQETTLAERKFGPGLKLGITVPLEVKHGKLKGIDFEQIEFEKPDFSNPAKRDKLLEDAMEESRKPTKPEPPGREEALKIIKRLPAKASAGINIFNFDGERYSYIFKLHAQYPEQDWSFIPKELKKIENNELHTFRNGIFAVSKGIFGMSLVEYRLFLIKSFEENHKYVDKAQVNKLREEVKNEGNNA